MSTLAFHSKIHGFTLAELLIIVVVIILLAAIALPNLLRSQLAANEAGAIASLSIINQAQSSYQSSYPTIGFATALQALGPAGSEDKCQFPMSQHACLIEVALAQATSPERHRSGYWYALTATGHDANGVVSAYVTGATPVIYNKTGTREFCSKEDGVIRSGVGGSGAAPMKDPVACAVLTPLQ